jgi:hypothetical protein
MNWLTGRIAVGVKRGSEASGWESNRPALWLLPAKVRAATGLVSVRFRTSYDKEKSLGCPLLSDGGFFKQLQCP